MRIAALYDALSQLAPSPIVELNRAVALGMAFGPEAGLELVDRIADEPALRRLPPAAQRPRRPAGASSAATRRPRPSSAAPPS